MELSSASYRSILCIRLVSKLKIEKLHTWGHAQNDRKLLKSPKNWYFHDFYQLKSQFTYVGPYSTVVFYIRGLLLCRWHTVPTCSRIPSSKFENSNILDHAHSILKHLYCWLWTCSTPNFFRDGRLLNVPSDLKKWGKTD